MANPPRTYETPEPTEPDPVLGAELLAWANGEGSDRRELIVEATLPRRTVSLEKSDSGRVLPREVKPGSTGSRATVLLQLQHDLNELLGTSTSVLRAAGAIAVRADRTQLRQIARHPLVRAVRPNRRMKLGDAGG
jgi:hypothetical protein